ncbi:MAG: NosD domain-containing protein [Chloroflexota bacterium]
MTRLRALAAQPWLRPAAIAAAVGLALAASVLPVWVAQLIAPQYPKGLWLRAYGSRLEGDVREINGLNHYIGMRPLDAASIPELQLWPLAIGAALVLILIAGLRRGLLGRLALLGLWAIPLTILVDIQRWLYVFGHELDPDAALRVGQFTPLVIGPTQIWNFKVLALPGTALVALAGAAILVTVARRLPGRGSGLAAVRRAAAGAVAAGLTLALVAVPADAARALQPLVDAVPPGGTLVLEAGSYRGPVEIARPLTLRGHGDAVIDGGGTGTVVTVRAAGTTLEGLHVRGSGGQLEDAAAISVEADGVTVERVLVTDSYTGIRVRGARDVRIVDSVVRGRGGAVDGGIASAHQAAAQADGIALWDVTGALVRGNTIEAVRDGIYLSYASEVLIDGNRISGSRYAVHAMFGSDLMVFENEIRGNASGLVLMYPAGLTIARNTIADHRAAATGYAVLLKDVREPRVVENEIVGNAVGLKVEGVEGASSDVLRNTLAYNAIGVELSPRSALTFSANSFVGNVADVSAAGSLAAVKWTKHGVGNHWSGHAGIDVDGDGRSEVDHVAVTAGDRLTTVAPELRSLRGTIAFRLFERAARWTASAAGAVIVDRSPLTGPVLEGTAPPRPADVPVASVGLILVGAALGAVLRAHVGPRVG